MDTALNEFVYTALYKSDYYQKKKIPTKFIKAASSEKAARSFAENSTREEKEILLSALGYEFCYVINGDNKKTKALQEILPILESSKKSQISTAITERGFYVTTDRQLLRTLGLVSQTTHSPTYYMDLEILRQGYHINKWKKRYGAEKDNTYRHLDETARGVASIFANALLSMENSKPLFGCTGSEIKILLKLYSSFTDLSDNDLQMYFYGRMKIKEFKFAIRNMMNQDLIFRNTGIVSITGLGIEKINNYLNSVIHPNNF